MSLLYTIVVHFYIFILDKLKSNVHIIPTLQQLILVITPTIDYGSQESEGKRVNFSKQTLSTVNLTLTKMSVAL